jgi:exopolysaccharide production protein ExoZ
MPSLIDRIYSVPGGERFAAMEGLRAYAAFVVFLVHFSGNLALVLYGARLDDMRETLSDLAWPVAVLQYLHRSHYGVELFFLLSGFLIFNMVSSPRFAFGRFFANRLWRIYPVFVVTEALYIAYAYAQTGTLWGGGIVGNLLLLNGIPGLNFPAYNVPTWSLFFEFASYAVIPAAVALVPWSRGSRANGMSAAALLVLLATVLTVFHWQYLRFIMFAAGIALAASSRGTLTRIPRRVPDTLVAAVYLTSTAFFAASYNYLTFTPLYFMTALLLVNQALFGTDWLNKLFSARPLRYFGNISFSFYLIHDLCLKLVFGNLQYDPATPPLTYALLSFAGSLILATIAATVLFVTVEKPYFAYKHGGLSRTRAAPAREPLQ